METNDPENDLSDADRELESALARLSPTVPRIDARSLLARAEQARTARRIWAYRAVAAILAVALLISLLDRPKPAVRETVRTVFAPAPPPATAVAANPADAPPPALMEELQFCQELSEKGLAALPAPPPAAPGAHHPEPPLPDGNPLWN